MRGQEQFTAETQRDAEGAQSKSTLRVNSAFLYVSAVKDIHSHLFRRPAIFTLALLIILSASSASSIPHRAQQSEPVIEMVAVGDILLDRGIARQIERRGTGIVFARVREVVSKADLAFGNLECPLAALCNPSPQRIAFRAEPRYVETLTDAGFDLVSLANNHSMDCGPAGLLETMRHLKREGLRWCGAGGTSAEAEAPVILTIKGVRVAFVGLTNVAPPAIEAAKEDEPTVALASSRTLTRVVASARKDSDVVVVSLHWGEEYSSRPDREQVELAHRAVEAGADIVLGHHTHTLAGLELVRKPSGAGATRYALIAYSLGNFAFDSPRWLGKRVTESVILRYSLSRAKGLVHAEVLPVVLENYLPRPASPQEAQSILSRLTALSAERNTQIRNGRISLRD